MKKTKVIITVLFCFAVFSLKAQQKFDQDVQIGGSLSTTNSQGKKIFFSDYSNNSDHLYIARYNVSSDVSELTVHIGDDYSDKLVVGHTLGDKGNAFRHLFVVASSGKVGILNYNPTCELDVNGTIAGKALNINGLIRARQIKVETTGWSDFVFNKDYKLKPLQEVEFFIKENKHLPDIPSEKEVVNKGVDMVQMQSKLLQKIEELTLYIIEQDRRIKELEKKMKME